MMTTFLLIFNLSNKIEGIDYISIVVTTDTQMGNELWYALNESERYYRKRIVWDSTQPMFAYNEESVMSFTDYLCNCGGLFGLWFGTNAKDFIIWLIESQFWISVWHRILEYLQLRTPVIVITDNNFN